MAQRLAQHLLSKGVLQSAAVDRALIKLASHGGSLDTALLETGSISEMEILPALFEVSGVRPVNLADYEPNVGMADLIPEKVAQQHGIVPLSLEGKNLHVASVFPIRATELRDLGFHLGRRFALWVAIECRIKDWQAALYKRTIEPRYASLLEKLETSRAISQVASATDSRRASKVSAFPVSSAEKATKTKLHEQPRARSGDDSSSPSTANNLIADEGNDETAVSNEAVELIALEILEEPILLATSPASASQRESEAEAQPSIIVPRPRDSWVSSAIPAESATPALPVDARPSSRPFASIPPLPPIPERKPALRRATQHPSKLESALHPSAAAPGSTALVLPTQFVTSPSDAIVRAQEQATKRAAESRGIKSHAAPPSDWTLADARAALRAVSGNRNALISVILDFAMGTFEFAGVFAIIDGIAVGWDSRGSASGPRLQATKIPLDVPSAFRTVSATRASYIGPIPKDEWTSQYLQRFGRDPRTLFLWPVEVKKRLVLMIYGDRGQSEIVQRKLAEFILFCLDLPEALNALIVRMRSHSAPDVAQKTAGSPTQLPQSKEPEHESGRLHRLISLLLGPDSNQRALAGEELMKTPAPSAKALAEAFPGPTGWSRVSVQEVPDAGELGPIPGMLVRLGSPGSKEIVSLLASSDASVRYFAMLTAGCMPAAELVPGIFAGMFDAELEIASAARAAAREFGAVSEFGDRLPELRSRLRGSEVREAALAAQALGAIRDRESIEILFHIIANSDGPAAQPALEALQKITCANFGFDREAWGSWWAQAQHRRRADWLVDALEFEGLATRQVAIEELSRAYHDTLGYIANSNSSERAEGVSRWRAHVALHREVTV